MRELNLARFVCFASGLSILAAGCNDSKTAGASEDSVTADSTSDVSTAEPEDAALPEPDLAGPSVVYDFALETAHITANPNNVLSCYVEWETTVPATAYVEFGPRGQDGQASRFEFRTSPGLPTTQHRVFVAGLYEGDWDLRAVSETPAGKIGASETLRWRSEGLPEAIPRGEVETLDADRASDQWILTQLGAGTPWISSATYAVMYDLAGRPRWYMPHPKGPATLSTLVNDGTAILLAGGSHVHEVNLEGATTWTSPVEPEGEYTWWDFVDGSWHHEFHKLPNGNYAVLRIRDNNDEAGMRTDYIEEMNPLGETVWQFNTTPINDSIGTWCYGSAAEIDHAAGKAWFASRNGGIVAQIDYNTHAVDWILGGKGSLAQSPGGWKWFTDPHAPVVLGNNRILLFDDSPADVARSRAVELQVDAANGTASLVWEYPPAGSNSNIWYSPGGGNAQRLDNGNTAIAALEGSRDGDAMHFEQTRFMEVTPDGTLVSYMRLPGASIIYRGYRIPALHLEDAP